jgi:hypothetical protein
MKQAEIEFSSRDELNDFLTHANPFILEKTDKTVLGLFTEIQLELARNGFDASIYSKN